MSRIASRTRTSESTSRNDQKHNVARVPLGRISTNRLSRPVSFKSTHSEPKQEKEYVQLPQFKHKEVPIGSIEDPQDVAEFEHIIYRTLRAEEIAMKPLEFIQKDITLRDRNMIIDAVCRYHYKLGLMTNTFYRFIGILDRYLSVAQVPKNKLKLYACAAFLIASKIEDIYPAQSSDLISLSERAFTRRELFAAEIQIANSIEFSTTFATPLFYLTIFMRINGQTKESMLLARYIMEICQSNEKFFGVQPAIVASVSVMVTRILTGESQWWPKALAEYTVLTEEQLMPYAKIIRAMLVQEDREETKFMRRKYCSDLFLKVGCVKVPSNFK